MTTMSLNPAPPTAAAQPAEPLDEQATHAVLVRAAAACADQVIAEMLAATGRSPQAVLALDAQRRQFNRLAAALHANDRERARAQLAGIRRRRAEAA